jgi:hypothetical protein
MKNNPVKLALSDKFLITDGPRISLLSSNFTPFYHKLPSLCRVIPGIFYLHAHCRIRGVFPADLPLQRLYPLVVVTLPLSIKRHNCGKNTLLSGSVTIVIE